MDKFDFFKITDITLRKRAHVVAVLQHTSMSIQKIGEELNLSKSSVGRIFEMRENRCDVSTTNRRDRYGRKRKTTTHDDKMILRNSLKFGHRKSQR